MEVNKCAESEILIILLAKFESVRSVSLSQISNDFHWVLSEFRWSIIENSLSQTSENPLESTTRVELYEK